tara:strand:- start:3770 stop:4375 length:606 start_codon:yes stop_codon:yes gene_type:complete
MKKQYSDTEIKIKNAAKYLFQKQGFSATTTRDIARDSKINLALLNYHFTSKRKLFEIIMLESMYDFISKMVEVYNDEKSTLEEKLKLTSSKYIDMIIAEPHLPSFVVNELKNNPSSILNIFKGQIMESKLVEQYNDGIKKGIYKKIDPIHFVTNILSLIVFPFISSPIIIKMKKFSRKEFNEMMNERKKLIPEWIIQTIKK